MGNRHTRILHRMPGESLPLAASGDGVYLVDSDGRRYLDASSGAAVSCLGHSEAVVTAAIREQLDRVAFAHTSFFSTQVAEELADLLVERAPTGIDRVCFVSGGSEAIEASLKLARQYFLEIGQPQRRHFIARRQSYHGNTLGALSVGGNLWRRRQFEPLLMPASHVSPCYAYREQQAGESTEAYAARLADELEQCIEKLGAEQVIAFIAEPVVGATAGVLPAVEGYFRRIREVCDRHGILLILDEVMCGAGRTGTWFACEQDGVSPDIVAIAKGLGAGYQPIGATLMTGTIYDAIVDGSGYFQHGHTYMAHATACAAALAVQRVVDERELLANVRRMGALLDDALRERFGEHPRVGDIRGRGLFIGLELVADRDSKAPLDPTLGLSRLIRHEGMARGLICYPGGGTIDGRYGDHVLLAPPYIIEPVQVTELVDKLAATLDAALARAGVRV